MTENETKQTKTKSQSASYEDSEFQELLRGKTFKTYWYLLLHKEGGVREIQRNLGFSSPNIVSHHLRKLVDADIVWQNPENGKYEVKREVKTGVLSLYVRVGRHFIPRNVFVFTSFLLLTVLYILFVILTRGSIVFGDFLFFGVSLLGLGFLGMETWKIWRLKPL